MSRVRKLLLSLFALGVVGGVIYGIFSVGKFIFKYLTESNPDVGKVIIAGSITIVVSVISVVLGKFLEQRVKLKEEVRQKKLPVYEELIARLFVTLFSMEKDQDQRLIQLTETFRLLTPKLMVWGGPDVIKTWTVFRLYDWSVGNPVEAFGKYEDFIKAIRTELGTKNSGLESGDLIKLFINDYDRSVHSSKNHTK
jgi:hypothetical protein